MEELVMKNSGLTVTIVMQANSANYGESIGNVSSFKEVNTSRRKSVHLYF